MNNNVFNVSQGSKRKLGFTVFFAFVSVAAIVMLKRECSSLLFGSYRQHLNLFLMLLGIFFIAAALPVLAGLKLSYLQFSVCCALSALSLLLRAFCLDFVSNDYTSFLRDWIEYFRTYGGFKAISGSVGDYNVPYLYYIAFISQLHMPDLYMLKLLSILFDYLLAFSALRIVKSLKAGTVKSLAAYIFVLFTPTVVLNSAYWGQCDGIYAAFALLSLSFALEDKPVLSVAAIAVAFSVKLQTVFIMPVFLAFIFAGKMRFKHLATFPAVYFLTILPALLLGKPLLETLTIYTNQVGSYSGYLTLNAPSIFAFLPENVSTDLFEKLGILVAASVVLVIFIYLYKKRDLLDNRALLLAALVFTAAIPLLLPKMHDRYLFLADVLSVTVTCVYPRRLPLPFFIVTASYTGYHAYLKLHYIGDMRVGAALLIVGVVLAVLALTDALKKRDLDPRWVFDELRE